MTPDRPLRPRRLRVPGGARTRILASYLILLAFSSLVSTFAIQQILVSRTGERVDRSLVQEIDEFRRLVADGRDPRTGEPFGTDVKAIFDVFLARNVPGDGEAFLTFVDGRSYKSTRASAAAVELLRARYDELAAGSNAGRADIETSEGNLRYLAVPVKVQGRARGLFAVYEDLGAEREQVDDSVRVIAGVSVGVLMLASLLAFLVAGRVLSPLRALDRTARSISETDLTQRIDFAGDDEIAELARTFDLMLDRLEQAFVSQKDFVSDAGHELRTPITIIRGHLEVMGEDPAERRETIELVTDELDRMTRFVDDLLLLAKARQPDFLRPEPLDLDAVAEELFVKAQALAPRDWSLDAHEAAGRVIADRQRLTQAVMNLATNAARHTSPDEPVEIGAALRAAEAHLWVADRGPGVPAAERERIFERFTQAGSDRRRADGAGLGLAIVRAIAEAHGGRVELDTAEGVGSRFTIIIPAEMKPDPIDVEPGP